MRTWASCSTTPGSTTRERRRPRRPSRPSARTWSTATSRTGRTRAGTAKSAVRPRWATDRSTGLRRWPPDYLRVLLVWKALFETTHAEASRHFGSRYVQVRHEDFAAAPEETLGKLLRVGHMGPTAQPAYALVAVAAVGGAMRALGIEVDVAAGLAAAQDHWDQAIG